MKKNKNSSEFEGLISLNHRPRTQTQTHKNCRIFFFPLCELKRVHVLNNNKLYFDDF